MVSVIVPVYNAEKTLGYCISSILRQSYCELELILINDGSQDKSLEICNNYRELDSRIRVIDIPNGGVSNARNIGIKESQGDYIAFVDSDDYIASDMLEVLCEKMEQYNKDIVICGMNIIELENDGVKKRQYSFGTIGDEVVYSHKLFMEKLPMLMWRIALMEGPCNRMYNATVIRENNITFPTDTSFGEDFLFNLEYYQKANGTILLNKPYYYYIFSNEESLSHKFKKDLFYNQKRLMVEFRKVLIDEKVWKKCEKTSYYNYLIGQVLNCIKMLFHENNELDKEQIKKELAVICNDELVRKGLEQIDYIPEGTNYILDGLKSCDIESIWWNSDRKFVKGIDCNILEECEGQKEECIIPNPGYINRGVCFILHQMNKVISNSRMKRLESSLRAQGIKRTLRKCGQ
ncbi:MAG: glycosyltransferase family 2 protein [Lachnospiraceae bacterium]